MNINLKIGHRRTGWLIIRGHINFKLAWQRPHTHKYRRVNEWQLWCYCGNYTYR